MYNDVVMDHFMNPRNVGEIENPDGVGEVGNIRCGDIMKIFLRINEEEVVEDIKFKTFGCGSAVASSSVATEMIKGKTVTEALKITNKDVLKELGGLPVIKVHCSVLAEQALKAAVLDYANKRNKHYPELDGFDPDTEHEH
ncbi:MAG TPA: Fe-S cluster assembly scaffold protein NifU [Clostridia bacterium]|nr:Fe-S cluster assembly scaffold protein NifU [Clostridia bacterium]